MKHELENIDDIYREAILDLYRNPLNKHSLIKPDIYHQENNPLCGDEVEIFIKFDKSDNVSEVGYQGDGCAISMASASLVTDKIKGMSKAQIMKMTREDVLGLLGLENLNPTRQRCALLILKALQKGIENQEINKTRKQ